MNTEKLCTLRAGTKIVRLSTPADRLIGPHRLFLVDEPETGLAWILQDGERDPVEQPKLAKELLGLLAVLTSDTSHRSIQISGRRRELVVLAVEQMLKGLQP